MAHIIIYDSSRITGNLIVFYLKFHVIIFNCKCFQEVKHYLKLQYNYTFPVKYQKLHTITLLLTI